MDTMDSYTIILIIVLGIAPLPLGIVIAKRKGATSADVVKLVLSAFVCAPLPLFLALKRTYGGSVKAYNDGPDYSRFEAAAEAARASNRFNKHSRPESAKRCQQQQQQDGANNVNRSVKDASYFRKVLGVGDTADLKEITKKYRELAAQYHPDKVSQLGPKIREVSEREMKELNEAYEFFKG